jgi:hypothetical protein
MTSLFKLSLRLEREFPCVEPSPEPVTEQQMSEPAEAQAQDEMRITENTPARLTLRDRTLRISVVCFAAAGFQVASFAAHGGEWSQLVLAALAVALGLPFLRATDVTFDKIRRTCMLRRFDIIRAMRKQLAFRDIRDIRVDVCPGIDSDGISCRLSLVTASGIVPMTVCYEPDLSRHNAMRDMLLDTLFGDSPRPAPVDPILDLVAEGHIVDAIKVLRQRDGLSLTAARARIDEIRDTRDA